MFYVINLLDADDLGQIADHAASSLFTDGSATAGATAVQRKRNEQAKGFDASPPADLLRKRLGENTKFNMAAFPARLSPLMLSRYENDMAYGLHTDNAIMHPNRLRSDLSFTIFLSAPDCYEGGELSIRTGDAERNFKLQAGQMLLYPAGYMHQVKPVLTGSRLVAVGWVQSLIADAQQRAILHDLSFMKLLMKDEVMRNEAETLLELATSNLLRLWAKC